MCQNVKGNFGAKGLMKFELSREVFEKYANVKFHENPSSGIRVVACGHTERYGEVNGHFPQFCERGSTNCGQIVNIMRILS